MRTGFLVAFMLAATGAGGWWWVANGQRTADAEAQRAELVAAAVPCLAEERAVSPACGDLAARLAAVMADVAVAEDDPGAMSAAADAWATLGRIEKLRGRLPEAVRAFERAAWFEPQVASNYGQLAEIMARTGRFGEAFRHADLAVQLDPLRWQAHRMRARVYAIAGERERAVEGFDAALRLAPLEAQQEVRDERATLERGAAGT